MRKILAAALLAAAALGTPAAEAGCYGVREFAKVCHSGDPKPTLTEHTYCVYTGGDTCDDVTVPWVQPGDPGTIMICPGPQFACLETA